MSRTRHHGKRNKQRQHGDMWWWWKQTPSWWNKLFHTKPRRVAEKQAIEKAVKHPDSDVVHPLDRKPHRYYW